MISSSYSFTKIFWQPHLLQATFYLGLWNWLQTYLTFDYLCLHQDDLIDSKDSWTCIILGNLSQLTRPNSNPKWVATFEIPRSYATFHLGAPEFILVSRNTPARNFRTFGNMSNVIIFTCSNPWTDGLLLVHISAALIMIPYNQTRHFGWELLFVSPDTQLCSA